jgi:tetratricopeptide (TPR) repeat protein
MIDALFDLFGTFYQRGDLRRAESIARSIMQAIPDDVVSLQLLGLVYCRTGRRREAVQAFDAADSRAHENGAAVGVDRSLQASAQCLRAASSQGSALAGAWYDIGLALLRLGRYRQAMSALQAAVSARPDFLAAQQAIVRIAELSGPQRPHVANHDPCTQARARWAGHPLPTHGRSAGQLSGRDEHATDRAADRPGHTARRHLPQVSAGEGLT